VAKRKTNGIGIGQCVACGAYITADAIRMGDALALLDPLEGQIAIFHLSHLTESFAAAQSLGLLLQDAAYATIFNRQGIPGLPRNAEARSVRRRAIKEKLADASK